MSTLRKILSILLLAGPFAYAFAYASESLVLSPYMSFPILLFSIALIEETAKWLVIRNFRFTPGLVFILVLAGMEAVLYALIAESSVTLFVIGVTFWYILLFRFIFGGHVMFYLASRLASEISEIAVSENGTPLQARILRMTGKNVNVIGWSVGVVLHVYWNYFAILGQSAGFFMFIIPLSFIVLIAVMRYLVPAEFKMK